MFKKLFHMVEYMLLLIREIVIANIAVAKIVLSFEMKSSPVVVRFESRLNSEILRVVLANSITLTPGTLTVDLEDGVYTVHCLKEEFAKDLNNSRFEKILLNIEGE